MKEKNTTMAGGMPGNYGYSGPGNIPPPPPAPVKKSGGNGCLIGGLVGCGALLLVLVVGAIMASRFAKNSGGFSDLFKGAAAGPKYAQKLSPVSNALMSYRSDNKGKYPPSLSALVPKYLADKSALSLDEGKKMEYTPPTADSKPESPVISIYTGSASLIQTQSTIFYVRLLKNGSIVQDQVTRTELKVKDSGSRGTGKSSGDKPDSTE